MDRIVELFDGYSMGILSGFSREELDSMLGTQGVTVVIGGTGRRRVFLDETRCDSPETVLKGQRRTPRPVPRETFAEILRGGAYGYGLYAEEIGKRSPRRPRESE